MFKTKKLYVPHGIGDVLNTHILDSVRLRIDALRGPAAPGFPPDPASVAEAGRLEALLLEGAPSVQEQAAREAAFAELPVGPQRSAHILWGIAAAPTCCLTLAFAFAALVLPMTL